MILRDPVHGLIAFEAREEQLVVRLVETAELQRLRRIRQLGVASLAYPGAEHTRFSHAIGTAYVMKRLVARLREVDGDLAPDQRICEDAARAALCAALLHDVGHGPLSHLYEEAIPNATPHEDWGRRIVVDPESEIGRVLASASHGLVHEVADLLNGVHRLPYLARAVSGTVDVDRCDYLLRDAHATGVPYGRFDLDWLLRALRFAPTAGDDAAPALAIDGAKGIVSIESFILARLFMFQQVYFHKTSRAADWMIRALVSRIAGLVRSGATLPVVPAAIASAARGDPVELHDYLELDDGVLFGAMHAWESAKDPVVSDLARRLRSRSLFKTLELYESDAMEQANALATAQEIATRAGLDPHVYTGLDTPTDTPFSDEGDPLRVVFPHGPPRRPAEVSFLLGRLRNETVTRVRLIVAPELRDRIVAAIRP